MAYQPMTVDEYHRCMSCGHSHPFVAEILGVCPRCAKQKAGITTSGKNHSQSHNLYDLPEKPPVRLDWKTYIPASARARLLAWATSKHKEATPCDLSTLYQVG
jgi:predicted  nucleic acid-binding Zn-ribbon protein